MELSVSVKNRNNIKGSNDNDFPKETEEVHKDVSKRKRRFKWWVIPVVVVVGILVAVGVYANRIVGTLRSMGIDVNIGTVGSLIFNKETPKLKADDGRTNFLLVGLDTRPNSGLMNTDTLMIISLDNETGSVSMISVPRDTEVRYTIDGKNYRTKVNTVYWRYAQKHGEEEGMEFLKETLSGMIGQPIHYSAIVNYYGFVEAIDQLGGLEVCVERSFSARYPKPGKLLGSAVPGQEITVRFEAGCQFMDGERALIYARARKSNSVEGSDYARAARQQIVAQAFFDKFKESSWYAQYDSAMSFLDILGSNVKLFGVEPEDLRAGYEMRDEIDTGSGVSVVLSPSIDYFRLIKAGSSYNNVPVGGDWTKVHGYVSFILEHPDVFHEEPKINVYDGGGGKSKARSVAEEINSRYLYAKYVGTADVGDCGTNQIAIASGAETKNASLIYLQALYNAQMVSDPPVTGKGSDIILIVCVD